MGTSNFRRGGVELLGCSWTNEGDGGLCGGGTGQTPIWIDGRGG
jgi:hypothetical protein